MEKPSAESIFCLKQTIVALVGAAEHLMDDYGLETVLLGKMNSDKLEKEFGVLRSLAGADFFLSMKQFLEGVKKIRIKNLVKLNKLSAHEIRDLTKKEEEMSAEELEQSVIGLLSLLPPPEEYSNDIESLISSLSAII